VTTNGTFITEDIFLAAALKTVRLKFLEVTGTGSVGSLNFKIQPKEKVSL
jgi:hypothetical protein